MSSATVGSVVESPGAFVQGKSSATPTYPRVARAAASAFATARCDAPLPGPTSTTGDGSVVPGVTTVTCSVRSLAPVHGVGRVESTNVWLDVVEAAADGCAAAVA